MVVEFVIVVVGEELMAGKEVEFYSKMLIEVEFVFDCCVVGREREEVALYTYLPTCDLPVCPCTYLIISLHRTRPHKSLTAAPNQPFAMLLRFVEKKRSLVIGSFTLA
jgi:hypothetical protein